MAANLHHGRVAHGDARDVVQCQRLLIVAQRIRWHIDDLRSEPE
jgi:hypothetical protein